MVTRFKCWFYPERLFGAAKFTTNPDPDEYSYSEYGIGFESHSLFSIPNLDWGKKVIIFRVDNSSSVHIDNKKKIYISSCWRSSTRIRWYHDNGRS